MFRGLRLEARRLLGGILSLKSPALAHEAGISATNLPLQILMPSIAYRMAVGMRGLSALLLLLTLVSVSLTCAAMSWTPITTQHPCCPHSQNPDSDRCAKIGCIGTAPVLVPNAADNIAPLLAVATVQDRQPTVAPSPEGALEPMRHPPESALFLAHHQLLV